MRFAKLNQIAYDLADKHDKFEICLNILVDDLKDYSKAIDYLMNIPKRNIHNTVKNNLFIEYLDYYFDIFIKNCEEKTIIACSNTNFECIGKFLFVCFFFLIVFIFLIKIMDLKKFTILFVINQNIWRKFLVKIYVNYKIQKKIAY